MKCGNCGSENIVRKNAKGRTFGYMKWDDLELKEDVELLTCLDCTNIILVQGDSELLDAGLKKSLEHPSKSQTKKYSTRFQVVKNGSGYQIRHKTKFFSNWVWITETNRKGKKVIGYYQNVEDAKVAAEHFVNLREEMLRNKTDNMVVVYDSSSESR